MSLKGRTHVRYRPRSGPPVGAGLPLIIGLILLYFLFR